MGSKEKLTQDIEKRKAALAKQAAEDSKATPEKVRGTRKQLKRAQRGLAKMARAEKILAGKKGEKKEEEGQSS